MTALARHRLRAWPAILVWALILAACGLRFAGLGESPRGFYCDEAAEAINIICLAEEQRAFNRERLPLFPGGLDGGRHSPVYSYFGVPWVRVFGTSPASFRGIAACFSLATLAGLYALARRQWGPAFARLVTLLAALSPWSFQSGRVAWDPSLETALLVWGLFFLLRAGSALDFALAGVLLSLTMYAYSAARLQVALLVPAILLGLLIRRRASFERASLFALVFTVATVPLAEFSRTREGRVRFEQVSVFGRAYQDRVGPKTLPELGWVVLGNVVEHLHPRFLFLAGDANLRHCPDRTGQLGSLHALALGAGLLLLMRRLAGARDAAALGNCLAGPEFLLFCGLGILTGILPAAITWDSLPHALRSVGAWPFFALIGGFFLWRATGAWPWAESVLALAALALSAQFLVGYFTRYPALSAGAFDAHVPFIAHAHQASGDVTAFLHDLGGYPPQAVAYHLVNEFGMSCAASRALAAAPRTQAAPVSLP